MAKQHFLYTEGGGFNPVIVKDPLAVEFLIIDLFCGAGGTSTGFHRAFIGGDQVALVMACINHDPKAIKSHWLNYPDVVHFEEDIRTVELQPVVDLIAKYRMIYPNAKIILWASLECTNFSKAKGGQARDADSRTLAEHLDRYIKALDPDYIQIENVVEFMSWGPLDENGKPISRKSGKDWVKWCKYIDSLGYRNEWKEMNSADFGAYTSRNRLFGCFAKPGLPIVWPESTHAKKPGLDGMFGVQLKWKAVKDVLDFKDEGLSIFNRKKPLVDASLERIEAGLIKFVAGGKEAFLLQYNSGSTDNRALSVDSPCNTIPTNNRFALAQTEYFLAKTFSGKPEGKVIPVTGPAGTITTFGSHQLIKCTPFIMKYNSRSQKGVHIPPSVEDPLPTISCQVRMGIVTPQPFIMNTNFKNVGSSIEDPAQTLTASRHHPYIVNPAFLAKYYGNGDNTSSIEEPAGTLVTKDRFSKIQPVFINRDYKTPTSSSIHEPLGALLTVPKASIVKAQPFILNPSHGGHCTGTDVPCVVIVARQDKAPLYLVQFHKHPDVSIPIYDEDSPVMIRIKKFMALYGLSDIKMRMLKVSELLPIQGFPIDYKLEGNQTDQKKFIGNSVVPHVVTSWCLAMANKCRTLRIAA
ncbi:DNA cytosine methyltransferase [Pedobacter metabolipauper]|uniref:DNA (cytosine-5-)-methyltransferase n=1 Tax=Pedobacter metabolipauper TaxID=425513 RepID=A0A4R6T1C6_9SPHI|nr:DNA cytosine methyltransferase [Pedobacter metabolipauper]TDQ12207.1 DNA (cytosine-5)-methyltransferase 1 [Pedobacter metabolipauper]